MRRMTSARRARRYAHRGIVPPGARRSGVPDGRPKYDERSLYWPMPARGTRQLLGGQTPAAFLARHWHKEPLVRARCRAGVHRRRHARRALRARRRATTSHRGSCSRHAIAIRSTTDRSAGPRLARLPRRNWTLLVQGVNLHSDAADALLRRFAFIPHARLDDVMVSYAAPGRGRRAALRLVRRVPAAGVRAGAAGATVGSPSSRSNPMRRFRSCGNSSRSTTWCSRRATCCTCRRIIAHDGTAVDECITYSIGFRAPLYQELAEAFLDHLRDTSRSPGRYADPDLRPSHAPGRIDAALQRQVATRHRANTLGRWRPWHGSSAVF